MFVKRALTSLSPCSGSFSISTFRLSMKAIQPKKPETDRDYFGRLAKEAIVGYNQRKGTCFGFVEVEKANIHTASGYTYFITFVVKDSCDDNQTSKCFMSRDCAHLLQAETRYIVSRN